MAHAVSGRLPASVELRRALRSMARAPGFSIAAVSLLALGFGATVAVLSVINAIYLSDLPFASPDRLVVFHAQSVGGSCRSPCSARLTSQQLLDWGEAVAHRAIVAGAASDIAHVRTDSPVIAGEVVGIVSWNLLAVLGIHPLLGRGFVKADEEPGAARVAILSYAFWSRAFASDTAVLGRSITTDEGVFRIVGVLPASAVLGPPIGDRGRPAFLVPASAWIERRPLEGFARLRDGATADGLKSALAVLFERSAEGRRNEPGVSWQISVVPLRAAHASAYSGSYPLLFASVLVVLGIVTADVAGLFLARLVVMRHEFAVRTALGADGIRIVAPVLAQGLLIVSFAGVLGLPFGWGATRILSARAGASLPYWTSVTPSGHVVAIGLGLLVMIWVCCCGAPALMVARGCSAGRLIPAAETLPGPRSVGVVRRWLVMSELICSFVLISAAGLLAKTLFAALRRDVGVESGAVEVMLDAADGRLRPLLPAAERLIAELRRLPGVGAVGAAARGRAVLAAGLTREGDAEMLFPPDVPVFAEAVTPEFFRALGTTILQGRDFDDRDVAESRPVVILGDSLARRLYPKSSAIGKRVKFGGPATPVPWLSIVGVVREARCGRLAPRCRYSPRMYMPAAQGFPPGPVYVRARISNRPEALLKAIPGMVGAMPGLRILQVGSVEARLDRELSPIRTYALITSAFALFAGGLAALGVYGLLAYVTSLRRRELAIRMALGATAVDIARAVVSDFAPIVGGALLAGGAASVVARRAMVPILYETSHNDWTVIGAAAVMLLALATAAALRPINSARRVDPAGALRVH